MEKEHRPKQDRPQWERVKPIPSTNKTNFMSSSGRESSTTQQEGGEGNTTREGKAAPHQRRMGNQHHQSSTAQQGEGDLRPPQSFFPFRFTTVILFNTALPGCIATTVSGQPCVWLHVIKILIVITTCVQRIAIGDCHASTTPWLLGKHVRMLLLNDAATLSR